MKYLWDQWGVFLAVVAVLGLMASCAIFHEDRCKPWNGRSVPLGHTQVCVDQNNRIFIPNW